MTICSVGFDKFSLFNNFCSIDMEPKERVDGGMTQQKGEDWEGGGEGGEVLLLKIEEP